MIYIYIYIYICMYYIRIMDNQNNEKVITANKITLTTCITETTKMTLLKLSLYFRDNAY